MDVLRGKKGFELLTNWVGVLFISILVFSFMLSIIIVSPWVNYVILVFSGVLLGHFIHTSRYGNRFPYYVLSFALLLGYLLGSRAGNKLVLLVVFLASIAITRKVLDLAE